MSGWATLTLVTDNDIGAIEPQARANTSPPPWGQTTWLSQRTEAKNELKVWLESAYPGIIGVADRVIDTYAPDWVFSLVGGDYADLTPQAGDDEENDVDLATIFASTSNRLYVGAAYQFDGLLVQLLDQLSAVASVLTVKYSGPTGWTTLTHTDGTAVAGKAFAQTGRITWTTPSDWQRRTLNGTGEEYFWIELSVSVALSGSVKASQLLPIMAPAGLKRVAVYLALFFILNGLERGSMRPEEWREKAAFYWDRAVKIFSDLKERGGIPIDWNENQVAEPAEVADYTPVKLRRA